MFISVVILSKEKISKKAPVRLLFELSYFIRVIIDVTLSES